MTCQVGHYHQQQPIVSILPTIILHKKTFVHLVASDDTHGKIGVAHFKPELHGFVLMCYDKAASCPLMHMMSCQTVLCRPERSFNGHHHQRGQKSGLIRLLWRSPLLHSPKIGVAVPALLVKIFQCSRLNITIYYVFKSDFFFIFIPKEF